jgi:hypothetical protein
VYIDHVTYFNRTTTVTNPTRVYSTIHIPCPGTRLFTTPVLRHWSMVNHTGYHRLIRFQKRLNYTNAQDQQAGLKEVLEKLTVYYLQGLRAYAQDIVHSWEYSFEDSRRSRVQGLRAHAQDIIRNYRSNLRPSRRTSAFTKLWGRLNTRIESLCSRYRT